LPFTVPRNRTFPQLLKIVAICNSFSESYSLTSNNNLKNPQFSHNKYFCKDYDLADFKYSTSFSRIAVVQPLPPNHLSRVSDLGT
ncbi:hypothetical protein VIGAN_04202200, partial [Vigna angularis var. angularis]